MLFSSIPFLYYFLPCVLLLYAIAPKKLKNTVLMLTSLVFYGWGEPKYVILMVATIAIGYVTGLLIEKWIDTKPRLAKLMLIVSVAFCLGFLGYFKYANFFVENFVALTGLSVKALNVALPIGISFYTFQILSYSVDVYRKDVPAQKNPINLAAYIAMFPQLIAGPIVRYSDIAEQLVNRTHTWNKTAAGIRRFILGLAKKVLLANILGEVCDAFKASDDKSVLFFWLYAVCYMLHVYFDFSGYSDMAIGLGHLFGFRFVENFNYPYISASVTEFWRRWHISLGSWSRDYVYIPLGGNRVGKLRHCFNIFVVWMLTGFWHGADWTFIVWGIYFAILLMIEKFFLLKYLKKTKIVNHIYVLLFVLFSFVIFNASDMGEAVQYLGGLFGIGGYPLVSESFFWYLRNYLPILWVGCVGATPAIKTACNKLHENKTADRVLNVLEPLVLIALLLTVTAFLVDGSYNPFLYFRF